MNHPHPVHSPVCLFVHMSQLLLDELTNTDEILNSCSIQPVDVKEGR